MWNVATHDRPGVAGPPNEEKRRGVVICSPVSRCRVEAISWPAALAVEYATIRRRAFAIGGMIETSVVRKTDAKRAIAHYISAGRTG